MNIDNDIEKRLWCERFRPHCVAETILPARIKGFFKSLVDDKQVQSYTAVGLPGSGKTSSARALLEELDVEYLVINASENGNIDTIRSTVKTYASTMTMFGDHDYKVIILDEADGLTPVAQGALRGIIEEFAENCRFILTANYGNKIIDALKSRCPVIDFQFTKEERNEMLKQFLKRVRGIMDDEKIEYSVDDLVKFCVKTFPDFRKTLNLLQRNCHSGILNIQQIGGTTDAKIAELCGYLKDHDFTKMRKWVAENMDSDTSLMRRTLYDKSYDLVEHSDIPELVLILAEYDYKEGFCVDKEICCVAMLTQIMTNIKFN